MHLVSSVVHLQIKDLMSLLLLWLIESLHFGFFTAKSNYGCHWQSTSDSVCRDQLQTLLMKKLPETSETGHSLWVIRREGMTMSVHHACLGFVVSCPCRRTDSLTSLPFVYVLLVRTLPVSCRCTITRFLVPLFWLR